MRGDRVSSRIAGIAVVLMLVFAGTASAKEQATSDSQVSTTPGTSTTGTSTTDPDTGTTTAATTAPAPEDTGKKDADDEGNEEMAVGIILLGAFGVLMAYVFYDRWRGSYENLALSVLKTTGSPPVTIFNPAEDPQFRSREITAEAASQQPVVSGPATVVVGEPTTYKAEVSGGSANSCTWQVKPEGAATVQPSSGATVIVTATKEGPFTLSVKSTDGEPTLAPVTAIGKASQGGVPLLGGGFAGVVAVIIAVAIAGSLTALGTLGADAFIAFLGPILGYFFAQTQGAGEEKKAGAP